MSFALYSLDVAGGSLALSPLPGRSGDPEGDLAVVLAWRPDLVLTMTERPEMAARGAAGLGGRLAAAGVAWLHLPVADYGVPEGATADRWPDASRRARAVLARGGRVLVHCHGGCGRSGMAALRLMVETGEPAADALARLRAARPCAIETAAQMAWAADAPPDERPDPGAPTGAAGADPTVPDAAGNPPSPDAPQPD